jgi:hypothetical protein
MLIAEDLLLLLTDDETGKHIVDGSSLDLALAGANLVELARAGKVDVAGEGESVRRDRIIVRDASPTGDPLLDETLGRCAEKQGKKPASVLQSLAKGVRKTLLARLADRGVLRADEHRVLGIFPTTRWPAVDSRHETQVRELLTSALVQGTTPDQRTASLIALLSSVDAAHKVVNADAYGVDKKTIKERAKKIREGTWAADAVVRAIQAIQAAVTASIVAASVASTAGTTGS